jgi:hypothetical protein
MIVILRIFNSGAPGTFSRHWTFELTGPILREIWRVEPEPANPPPDRPGIVLRVLQVRGVFYFILFFIL